MQVQIFFLRIPVYIKKKNNLKQYKSIASDVIKKKKKISAVLVFGPETSKMSLTAYSRFWCIQPHTHIFF